MPIDTIDVKAFIPLVVFLGWTLLGRQGMRSWMSLGIALLATATVEVTAYVMMMNGMANLWLYNVYLCVQMPLMSWLVRDLSKDGRLRSIAVATTPLSLLFIALEVWLAGSMEHLLSGSAMLNNLLIAMLFTWLLFEFAMDQRPLFSQSRSWVAFAYLLFAGCAIPISGLLNYLTERDAQLAWRLFVLHDVVYALHFGILAVLVFGPLRRQRTQIT